MSIPRIDITTPVGSVRGQSAYLVKRYIASKNIGYRVGLLGTSLRYSSAKESMYVTVSLYEIPLRQVVARFAADVTANDPRLVSGIDEELAKGA
jgi:hypothetical protein